MESEFLAWLDERLGSHPLLQLGPGDDAALLRLGERTSHAVTADLLTEHVDFRLGEATPRRIGHKALAVNLSDLAAMAARPVAAIISLALPRQGALALAQGLYEGILPLAERFDVAIAGGDTNTWDGPLVIAITAIGEVAQGEALTRSGAQSGDAVVVTGEFGGSILGRHLDVEPRVDEALKLVARGPMHAGMDVSDGLSLDLSRMCRASGVGAVIDLSTIPIASAAEELSKRPGDSQSAIDHALSDGEDFELIFAIPPATAQELLATQPLEVPLTQIGTFVEKEGLWQRDANGNESPLEPRGYLHGGVS